MNVIINDPEAIGEESGVVAAGTGVIHADRSEADRSRRTATYLDDDLPEGPHVGLEVADTGFGAQPPI